MAYPSEEEYEKMSSNQQSFVRSCLRRGFKLRSYFDKTMTGRYCPAIVIEPTEAVYFTSKTFQDYLGIDIVIYAKD